MLGFREGMCIPAAAADLQAELGKGTGVFHFVPQTCSLLCLVSPSVEPLFIFPEEYASGLFGDMVVASLDGIWAAIRGLTTFILFTNLLNKLKRSCGIIRMTYFLNHLRESC